MISVVDTSAAIAVALERPGCDRLAEALAASEHVIAPELFAAELTNAFWKYHHIQGMPLADCRTGLDDALALADELVPHHDLCREVLATACSTGRAAYDLFFLVLARRHDAVLITLDAKLVSLAKDLGVGHL